MWPGVEVSCRNLCAVRWVVIGSDLHITAVTMCFPFHYFLSVFLGVGGLEHVVGAGRI